ncbi:MAG: proline racemase family protein [Solirubrobacterales bacterium]|nr:proline racemase family protein [Solirubrobacterales bacterium]
MQLTSLLHAVDAHAEGELTRVVVGGLPRVPGATMADKRLRLLEDDRLRRSILFEPRGHVGMHAVCVFDSADPEADAGIVIMEATDYPAMSGSNAICAATVLLETGMVAMSEPTTALGLETPAGLVVVQADCRDGRCERVRFENVPAYVVALDVVVEVPGAGRVVVDVAWGGAFFAFVDAATLGLQTVPEQAGRLAEAGRRITAAVAEQVPCVHPTRPDLHTVTFTTFTDRPRAGGDGRNATVIKPGRLDRSACGTATSARLAVLHARGELAVGEQYVHESVISTTFTGRIEGLTTVGGVPAVRPSISGRAWITGTHQIGRDPRDPLGAGFALADTWSLPECRLRPPQR